jgi:hypothetical protein
MIEKIRSIRQQQAVRDLFEHSLNCRYAPSAVHCTLIGGRKRLDFDHAAAAGGGG